jgi:hypothetical protein
MLPKEYKQLFKLSEELINNVHICHISDIVGKKQAEVI